MLVMAFNEVLKRGRDRHHGHRHQRQEHQHSNKDVRLGLGPREGLSFMRSHGIDAATTYCHR